MVTAPTGTSRQMPRSASRPSAVRAASHSRRALRSGLASRWSTTTARAASRVGTRGSSEWDELLGGGEDGRDQLVDRGG